MTDKCKCTSCGTECVCSQFNKCKYDCKGGESCNCHTGKTHKCPSCEQDCNCLKDHEEQCHCKH